MKTRICEGCTGRDGFTLIEVLVITALIAVVAGLTLPIFHRGDRASGARVQCMSNLKGIAVGYWVSYADNGEVFPWEVSVAEGGTMDCARQGLALPHFLTVSNYVKTPRVFVCPGDEERKPAGNWAGVTTANLSYFINTASTTNWLAGILSGDRNVALNGQQTGAGLALIRADDKLSWAPGIHGKDAQTAGGHVAFLDGHVEFSRENLNGLFERSGLETNYLAIP